MDSGLKQQLIKIAISHGHGPIRATELAYNMAPALTEWLSDVKREAAERKAAQSRFGEAGEWERYEQDEATARVQGGSGL